MAEPIQPPDNNIPLGQPEPAFVQPAGLRSSERVVLNQNGVRSFTPTPGQEAWHVGCSGGTVYVYDALGASGSFFELTRNGVLRLPANGPGITLFNPTPVVAYAVVTRYAGVEFEYWSG